MKSSAPPDVQFQLSQERLTRRILWTFLALHVSVWTAASFMTSPNCPLDMVEMLYWGRGWQLGYYKHPPLPAWLAQAVFQLSGGAVWPLFLVAQAAVATCFWAAWRLAREFLPAWPALCASLLLDSCVYFNFLTADLNNSILLQPLWALSALFLYWGITSNQLRYWAATGVCLGLGMLTKYDMATLVLAMLCLPLVNRDIRRRAGVRGPALTAAIALLVFAPHAIWMIQNDFPTINYVINRGQNQRSWIGHFVNPIQFLAAQALCHLPMLAIAWPLWWKDRTAANSGLLLRPLAINHVRRDFLLAVCLGPLAIDLLVSLFSGMKLLSMWGAPMWTYSGLLLVIWGGNACDWRDCRRVVFCAGVVGAVLSLALVARNAALPYLRSKPSRVHFPGAQLAAVVQQNWQERTKAPLSVVAGSWWVAGNVGLHVPGSPQVYDFYQPRLSPWSGDRSIRSQGGVIVWEESDKDAAFSRKILERFPEAEILPVVALKWQTGAALPPARFRMAIVTPARMATRIIAPDERAIRR